MNFVSAAKTVVKKGDKIYISQEMHDFLVACRINPKEEIRLLRKKYFGNVGAIDAVLTLFFYRRV